MAADRYVAFWTNAEREFKIIVTNMCGEGNKDLFTENKEVLKKISDFEVDFVQRALEDTAEFEFDVEDFKKPKLYFKIKYGKKEYRVKKAFYLVIRGLFQTRRYAKATDRCYYANYMPLFKEMAQMSPEGKISATKLLKMGHNKEHSLIRHLIANNPEIIAYDR